MLGFVDFIIGLFQMFLFVSGIGFACLVVIGVLYFIQSIVEKLFNKHK